MIIEGVFCLHRDGKTGEVHPYGRDPCRYFVEKKTVERFLIRNLQTVCCRVLGHTVMEVL